MHVMGAGLDLFCCEDAVLYHDGFARGVATNTLEFVLALRLLLFACCLTTQRHFPEHTPTDMLAASMLWRMAPEHTSQTIP